MVPLPVSSIIVLFDIPSRFWAYFTTVYINEGYFLIFQIFPRSGFLDMWKMLPGIFQHFKFQILNFGKINMFAKMFDISAIPARSVWCSLPSGNPKSGCLLFVNGITSVRGDPADRFSRKFTHGFI